MKSSEQKTTLIIINSYLLCFCPSREFFMETPVNFDAFMCPRICAKEDIGSSINDLSAYEVSSLFYFNELCCGQKSQHISSSQKIIAAIINDQMPHASTAKQSQSAAAKKQQSSHMQHKQKFLQQHVDHAKKQKSRLC